MYSIHYKSPPLYRKKFFKKSIFLGAIGVSLFDMKELNPMLPAFIMPKMGQVLVEDFLSLKEVQNILNSGEKYDVIIGEVFLNEAVLAGFSHKLKAPLIAFNSASLSHFTEYYVSIFKLNKKFF